MEDKLKQDLRAQKSFDPDKGRLSYEVLFDGLSKPNSQLSPSFAKSVMMKIVEQRLLNAKIESAFFSFIFSLSLATLAVIILMAMTSLGLLNFVLNIPSANYFLPAIVSISLWFVLDYYISNQSGNEIAS